MASIRSPSLNFHPSLHQPSTIQYRQLQPLEPCHPSHSLRPRLPFDSHYDQRQLVLDLQGPLSQLNPSGPNLSHHALNPVLPTWPQHTTSISLFPLLDSLHQNLSFSLKVLNISAAAFSHPTISNLLSLDAPCLSTLEIQMATYSSSPRDPSTFDMNPGLSRTLDRFSNLSSLRFIFGGYGIKDTPFPAVGLSSVAGFEGFLNIGEELVKSPVSLLRVYLEFTKVSAKGEARRLLEM
jgi:hypothetical protein